MAFVNLKKKEVQVKIVYYGPGRGGKTTNLEYIYAKFNERIQTEMVTVKTHGDRTLFFDFLPVEIGKVGNYSVKIQLYTVPGQVAYNTTRKMVLQGADGIVFVADSQKVQRKTNIESLQNLKNNLQANNLVFSEIPLVFQYNKRDLEEAGLPVMPIETMDKDLNSKLKVPSFPGRALKGTGVGQTLKRCLALSLKHLKKELVWAE